jgi:exopolyphosphatase / guanosine-5'-triphosphate,3'-diphosphate pyrophosphatase
MKVAILDLGTNTFNLLIAETSMKGNFSVLENKKIPVKLGEGKISHGEIPPEAIKRGIGAINSHYSLIRKHNVKIIRAFGTSALRTSKNGIDFLNKIKTNTGIEVQIISGEKEAELIYYGVRQTLNLDKEKFAILDIGGGSDEFIIADMEKIIWKKSYPLGIARLLERFYPSDPITKDEIAKIYEYLAGNLIDLFKKLKENNIQILVGASGSFETFVTMINQLEVNETECVLKENSHEISMHDFKQLNKKLAESTLLERIDMKGLEPMRVEMIVLASLFVNFVLENHRFNTIIQSNYALKEGAVYEQINEL